MNIVLVGFKNCGKTTIGKYLAQYLTLDFIDTDEFIQQYYYEMNNINLAIRSIYLSHGEAYFRRIEAKCIDDITSKCKNSVISTGGGAILDEDNVKNLKKDGALIYLKTSYSILRARTASYLNKSFENIYNERLMLYEMIADITIDIENKTIQDSVKTIAKVINNHTF
jgi:shikimate kinase